MFALFSNGLVLIGIAILLASLAVVRNIVQRLPDGRARRRWFGMAGLILLFVIGYLGYIPLFWNHQRSLLDLVVPGIFFFGACFVWFSTYLALQTTLDVLRISDLEHETFTDPLTGIYNRRFMEQRLTEEISKARRYDFQLSVLMFDLDYFKRVNDEHGHQAGDRLLVEISKLVGDQLRDSDILARYGGEEFLIVAPNTGAPEAMLLAQRLRRTIESQGFLRDYDAIEPSELKVTVSIGISSFGDGRDNDEAMIHDADKNLYRAKSEGRNRVVAG